MNLEKKHYRNIVNSTFQGDLDFDIQPHPREWSLRSELVETKQTL